MTHPQPAEREPDPDEEPVDESDEEPQAKPDTPVSVHGGIRSGVAPTPQMPGR